jgi:hypothetical protein
VRVATSTRVHNASPEPHPRELLPGIVQRDRVRPRRLLLGHRLRLLLLLLENPPYLLHSRNHRRRLPRQLLLLRGLPEHAPEDAQFQLLLSRVGRGRLRLLVRGAGGALQLQQRLRDIQHGRLVPVLRVHQFGVRLVERVADRRLHRRALHRRAVPSAEAAHMHRVQGEDRRHQFDRRGHGLAGLPLLDSRSDQRQRREGGVRDETRLPRVHEGGKFCRHDGHAHSALRADRHHEHDDRQEPLSLQQETPGEFHRRKPLHGHDRIAALKHSGRTSGLSFASQIIEVSKFVRRRKVINFSRR